MTGRGQALAIALLACSPAWAHDGPPDRVFTDEPVGPYRVSFWVDADVGEDELFVIIGEERATSGTERVTFEAWPADRPLERRRGDARRDADGTYVGSVGIDRTGPWRVKIEITGPRGPASREVDIVASEPGYGRWDLVIYAVPFLMLAILLFIVWTRKRLALASPSS